MIFGQIRPWLVLNPAVLDAFSQIPREDFVPVAFRQMAYMDMPIPLENGESMLEPRVEARLIQSLELPATTSTGLTCLHVGVRGGYIDAILSAMGVAVYALEPTAELAHMTTLQLEKQGLQTPVQVAVGGAEGWLEHAPFDRILISGAAPLIPNALREQLKPEGCLVAIVDHARRLEGPLGVMRMERHKKTSEGFWQTDSLLETKAPLLRGFPQAPVTFRL